MSMIYALTGQRNRLILSDVVLDHFDRHRQRRIFSKEAGGQLFASYKENSISIEVATGPYRSDKRSRYLFTPDPLRVQQDIDSYYPQRLHFIGNWHTHPEKAPSPSKTDVKNTQQRFAASDHCLEAFVMIIVGLDPFPNGIYAALVNKTQVQELVLRG